MRNSSEKKIQALAFGNISTDTLTDPGRLHLQVEHRPR